MGAQFSTMASMMGKTTAQAGIPTQGFAASNIVGTAVPIVGDNKAHPNYPGNVGGQKYNLHTVGVAVVVIGAGYLVYHFMWEK